jgi:hypothetical protein
MKETTAQPIIKLKTRNIDQKALIVAIIFFVHKDRRSLIPKW